jgi:hypothetical protein
MINPKTQNPLNPKTPVSIEWINEMFKLKSSPDCLSGHWVLPDLLWCIVGRDDDPLRPDGCTSSLGFSYEGIVVCPVLEVGA